MVRQAARFRLDGKPVDSCRYGSGHINDTYLVTDEASRQYILQRINRKVFQEPESLMRNIAMVIGHLKSKAACPREVLTLIPTLEGNAWLRDEEGEYWRLYDFVSDSVCMDRADTVGDFRESAVAFGRFQRQLADFDTAALTETIPRFHDTPNRYAALRNAIERDNCGRRNEVGREIAFALEREGYADTLVGMLRDGGLPLRVTHNDTKLNNVLFDRVTRKALCVIDLDTVMPGLAAHDFGDSIRFGASTAREDERDLSLVGFSMELFRAYASGYLSACGKSLTERETATLRDGAKMMTLECGVRFLADHLDGDVYFHTDRPGQNLDRCRTQFKLVADMEKAWDEMQSAVLEEADFWRGKQG